MENIERRAVLVGVELQQASNCKEEDLDRSMKELWELTKACDIEPVAIVTQRMEALHKSLYIGPGKVHEVRDTAEKLDAELIIFDDSLSPSQLRNIQEETGKTVMDRTNLILDIFESRARTREAKLQVESAKLQYLLPRLVGMHEAMTRQGGTSGSMSSRGAGEKKLELDRRKIEHRISELRKELDGISGEREIQRKRRTLSRTPIIALVGYTNAGKSTIMNAMVDRFVGEEEKKVLEKNMLFATLDTTVRKIDAGNNREFLLTDTVGFIHKLPHSLVKAFRSTLEEVKSADLLLHVVDYSDESHDLHMKTTEETLKELDALSIPRITVFNKADLSKGEEAVSFPKVVQDKIYLSAKDDASINALTNLILETVYSDYVSVSLLIPYDKGNITSYFMEQAEVIAMEYRENGTLLQVRCHKADQDKYAKYLVKEMESNEGE